jgi:hypothetical protein
MVNQRYDVGKVKAKNVAIGNHAKAGDRTYSDAEKENAIYQVRQLIELLSVHASEIDSPGEIEANAQSVETALQKRKLNRARIENLVRRIASAIAGVTALANAIDAVQTAVSRLFT